MKHFRIFFLLFLFLFQGPLLFSQKFNKEASIDIESKLAKLDQFGNIYVVQPNNELIKFSSKGVKLWSYSNKNFGDIDQVDVKDPLRILVFMLHISKS